MWTLAAIVAVIDGSGVGCETQGVECQAEGSASLSMLQRTSEARGSKRRQAGQQRPEWHDCDQPPSEPQTLNLFTRGILSKLNKMLQPFDLRECFVTYIGEEADYYRELATQPWVDTICETGFNAGHLAALMLSVNPHAKMYSFDLGDMPYSAAAMQFVQTVFGDRFSLIVGNSTTTLAEFAWIHPGIKCDLMIIDGGHEFEVSRADIANFQRLASPGRHKVLVDDTRCTREICLGPEKAWQEAVAAGAVEQLDRQGSEVQGWSLGSYPTVGVSWLEAADLASLPPHGGQ